MADVRALGVARICAEGEIDLWTTAREFLETPGILKSVSPIQSAMICWFGVYRSPDVAKLGASFLCFKKALLVFRGFLRILGR